ncbi:hypothetical protein ACH5RR_002354 [Cinchona calisaya]|uniref:DUF4408 domain-containing protein n=1 Tax=Cinchona calisaya TaxID=153742 RepID=A0ABD3B605_9GENT
MDSFDFHNIKMEKSKAKLRYCRHQKITAMFRITELCIFLIMISRFTAKQLPVAFKLLGEYFRGLSVIAVSPRFVFILGNTIVIVLFIKSGQFSSKENGDASTSNSKLDLYDEYVKNCEENHPSVYKEHNEKQRKLSNTCESRQVVVKSDAYISHDAKQGKVRIHRCKSEGLKKEQEEAAGAGRELRQSVTVRCRGSSVDCGEKPAVVEMSGEEFRQTVEAFIARQQRLLREEEEFSATVSF